MSYYFTKTVEGTLEKVEEKTREALKSQGFGVLTEIDVKETLKKKLNVNHPPYKILGACNPPFAHKALQTENQIGLMLPCNVVVQKKSEGVVEVSAIDPSVAMSSIDNPKLMDIAKEVSEKLQKVLSLI